MITDVFNRLVSSVDYTALMPSELFITCLYRSCHNKCVSPRYAEPDLNKGESVCIDRCVAKFFEVNKKVRYFSLCFTCLITKVGRWARNCKVWGVLQAEELSECSHNLAIKSGQHIHISDS